jgi:hypothetical protein
MVDCVSLSVISLPYLGWKVVVGAAAAAIVSPNYRLSAAVGCDVEAWNMTRGSLFARQQ